MEDVLASYETGAAFDEMIDSDGNVRPSYAGVYETLRRAAPDELRSIAESLANNYSQAGVTFDVGGVERPFPLDVVPRVIPADDWDIIDSGVSQRIRALEAFLADVYSDGRVITDGVIPRQLVTSSSHYHRAVWGIEPPNGVRVHVGGIDLIRTPEGDVRVLEDNVRVPSGVSYVMTNRSAMVTAMPEAFGTQRIRPVNGYPQRLLAALRKAAPSGMDDPTVVVLTPGVYNSAYFEHTLLARTMGVELVEGRDLECRRGRVFMRTTAGLRRVDVIYRRIDDDFIDPVHFRQDSMLGVPGLVNAVRSGGVALANAIGNGVADDKLIYTYVPDLIRYYLREEPIIRNVDTWRLEEDAAREEVMDRLAELVVKPVDGSGGKGIVIGPVATTEELDALRARVLADPRGWIAQPLVQLSTVPTLIGSGLEPRHVDLRPFAVNSGDDVWVLPGGLTRVALPKGEIVVNSSQGGGSKDTWVLSQPLRLHAPEAVPEDDEEDESETEVDTTPSPPAPPPPPAAPPGAAPAVPATAAAAATVDPVERTQGHPVRRTAAGRRCPRHDRRSTRVPAAAVGAAAADRPGRPGSRAEVGDAEPDRGVDVLDRPLRGARRQHRPDGADPAPADRRGHLARRVGLVPEPAGADEHRRRGLPGAERRRPAAAALLGRPGVDVDLLRLGRRPGQRPTGPGGDPARGVGVHQHHLAEAAHRAGSTPCAPTPSSTGPATAAPWSAVWPAAPWSATTAGSSFCWGGAWSRST